LKLASAGHLPVACSIRKPHDFAAKRRGPRDIQSLSHPVIDADTNARLARIESLMNQVLSELRARRRRGIKRGRSLVQRAADAVRYQPTELQIAAARRALSRRR
jgi:hypothetical protein